MRYLMLFYILGGVFVATAITIILLAASEKKIPNELLMLSVSTGGYLGTLLVDPKKQK